MSIIGLDPKRDKRAHQIIYGGFSGYVALVNFLGSCMGAPPMVSRMNNTYIAKLIFDKCRTIPNRKLISHTIKELFGWQRKAA